MSIKVGKRLKLVSRFIKARFKFLTRAQNFYVKRCSDCAANVSVNSNYVVAGFVGHPYPTSSEFSIYLRQSPSVNSSISRNDEEFRDLIRAAPARKFVEIKKSELDVVRKWHSKQPPEGMHRTVGVVPRSHSTVAVFGRIDENELYDESAEDIKLTKDHVFPGSRNHVTRNTRGF